MTSIRAGFVSIDGGATRSYTDSQTGILYEVDEGYVDTGRNAERYIEDPTQVRTWFTVRSFPDGTRNCYTIPGLKEGDRYLVRASFVHGNYDGQASGDSVAPPLLFDLYVGVNLWRSINITEVFTLYEAEIITAAPSDSLSTCLADIGSGTPFISSLESRHIDNHLGYQDANQYPEDKYDRTWDPCHGFISGCETWNFTNSTTLGIKTSRGDAYEVPGVVMGTATVAADNFTLHYFLHYGLNSNFMPCRVDGTDNDVHEMLAILFPNTRRTDRDDAHPLPSFPSSSIDLSPKLQRHDRSLIEHISGNGSRIFQVRANGEPDGDNISPAYLPATHVHFVHRLAYP
ncbi:receptor-like serine threonine-protein kinase, partial [Musa troglodytarum]